MCHDASSAMILLYTCFFFLVCGQSSIQQVAVYSESFNCYLHLISLRNAYVSDTPCEDYLNHTGPCETEEQPFLYCVPNKTVIKVIQRSNKQWDLVLDVQTSPDRYNPTFLERNNGNQLYQLKTVADSQRGFVMTRYPGPLLSVVCQYQIVVQTMAICYLGDIRASIGRMLPFTLDRCDAMCDWSIN